MTEEEKRNKKLSIMIGSVVLVVGVITFLVFALMEWANCKMTQAGIDLDQGYLETLMRNVEKLAKEANLELRLPSRLSNSKMALEIAEYAKNKEKFREYHNEVFKAYWLEERDIGDSEVLFDIVEKINLDVGDLKEYLKSGIASKKIAEYLREIRSYGISGVPTFFSGYDIFTGVQPYEVLKKAVEDALDEL